MTEWIGSISNKEVLVLSPDGECFIIPENEYSKIRRISDFNVKFKLPSQE
jgi:hypothetical protein